ncbi:hypothetical protein ES703_64435 [subsurface metagenome]
MGLDLVSKAGHISSFGLTGEGIEYAVNDNAVEDS